MRRMPKLKRFGFLYVNDDFGKGGFDAFTEAGKKYGMSITAEERYSRGDLDFTAQFTSIRATNPDAIVEWSRYTEGALIHRQIKQMGWELPRFGSDGIAAPAFLDLAKEAANGVIYPTHFSPATSTEPSGGAGLHCARAKTYNKPPDYVHAQAFDAINIALAAIERANSADRTAVRNALRQTDYQERARALQVRSERRPDRWSPIWCASSTSRKPTRAPDPANATPCPGSISANGAHCSGTATYRTFPLRHSVTAPGRLRWSTISSSHPIGRAGPRITVAASRLQGRRAAAGAQAREAFPLRLRYRAADRPISLKI